MIKMCRHTSPGRPGFPDLLLVDEVLSPHPRSVYRNSWPEAGKPFADFCYGSPALDYNGPPGVYQIEPTLGLRIYAYRPGGRT